MNKKTKNNYIIIISILLLILNIVSTYYAKHTINRNTYYFIYSVYFSVFSSIGIPLFLLGIGNYILTSDENKYFRYILMFIALIFAFNLLNIIIFHPNYNLFNIIFNPLNSSMKLLYITFALYLISPFLRLMVKEMTFKDTKIFLALFLIFNGLINLIRLVKPLEMSITVPLINECSYAGYFILGYLLNKYKKEFFKFKTIKYLLAFTLFIYLFLITYYRSINYMGYNDFILKDNNLLMMIFTINIYLILINKCKDNKNTLNLVYPFMVSYFFVNIIFNYIKAFPIYRYNAIIAVLIIYIILVLASFCIGFLFTIPLLIGRKYE